MSAKNIKIIIKAANQKIDDHVIDGNSTWSVGHLKSEISILHPAKPSKDDQRLIYSGHLLKNEQIISEICDHEETTLTIHMVFNQKASSMNINSNNKIENTDHATSANETQENNTSNNVFNLNPDAFMTNFLNVNHQMSLNNENMIQQMALMQQMYVQYMAQYMNQTGFTIENPFQVPVFNPLNPEPNQTINPVGNANNAAAQVNANVENIQNANNAPLAALNAGPGAGAAFAGGEEEDFQNHDWLDWFYWISRTLIFITILYLYSSLSRFIFVTGGGLLVYFYQNRLLNLFNADERRNEVPNNMNEQQLQQAMDGEVDPNTRHSRNSDNNNNRTEEVGQQNVQSGLKVAWIMISSLFTSLLPQPPEPVNLN